MVEEKRRVGRAGLCLRVKLRSEPRHCLVHDAFIGFVIHVDKERFPALRERGSIERVAVVLRRDYALVVEQVDHRLVLSAISKGQLVGDGTSCQPEQLVAETNTKHRLDGQLSALHLRKHLLDVVDSSLRHGRIARSVRKKKTIKICHLVSQRRIPWYQSNLAAPLHKGANNVDLNATISGKNLPLVALTVHPCLFQGDLGNEIDRVRVNESCSFFSLITRDAGLELNFRLQRALVPDLLRQQARVDAIQRRHLLLHEPLGKRTLRVPMRVVMRVV
mmetsp:Transcript_20293/g.50642  ORF Transcript_20293/g.50642 Transcript_20293/m.50642 type:complete len:276 (-) Transcript_20293:497-1324(-)